MMVLRFSTEPWALDSAIIRWRTQCWQSHVEFWDGTETLGARFSLIRSRSGTRLRPPSRSSEHVLIAEFNGIEKAYQWCLANRLGTPYNVKGIFGIATAHDWYSAKSRDCSHLIFEAALQGAGLELLDPVQIAPWKITPRDLLLSPYLRFL